MLNFRNSSHKFTTIFCVLIFSFASDLNAQIIHTTVSWVGDSVLYPGLSNNPQLRIEVEVGPTPISLTEFLFNTNGSSNPVIDISSAKLWFTVNDSSFILQNAVLIQTIINPWNTNFTFISAPIILNAGKNYFWMGYNIASGAYICDYTSGESISFKQNGIVVNTTTPFPNGFSIIGNGCLNGINENEDEIPYTIHPNPATDFIQLSVSNTKNEFIEIDIHDITGRKIKNLYSGNTGNILKNKQFSIHELNTGIYFLVAKSESTVQQLIFVTQ